LAQLDRQVADNSALHHAPRWSACRRPETAIPACASVVARDGRGEQFVLSRAERDEGRSIFLYVLGTRTYESGVVQETAKKRKALFKQRALDDAYDISRYQPAVKLMVEVGLACHVFVRERSEGR
jgi:hypothetical protein